MGTKASLPLGITGRSVIGLIRQQHGENRWNGTALVAPSTIADDDWETGFVTMSERLTSDGTPTGDYEGEVPSELPAGDYQILYYYSTDAAPGSLDVGYQDFSWDGSAMVGENTVASNVAAAKAAAEAVDTLTKTGGGGDLAAMPASVWSALISGLTTAGSVGKWMLDNLLLKGTWTDARAAKLDNLDDVSLGTGARTVVITVNDGTDPLEGAKVRMAKGAENYVATADVNGQISVGRDDGTWAIAITHPLYTFASTTLVVDGDEAQTYSMTAESIPASDPDFVTGYTYCKDEEGTAEEGVTVILRLVAGVGSGIAFDSTTRTGTSDANGLVTFVNLTPGSTYTIKRGSGEAVRFTIPLTATTPYALPAVAGAE